MHISSWLSSSSVSLTNDCHHPEESTSVVRWSGRNAGAELPWLWTWTELVTDARALETSNCFSWNITGLAQIINNFLCIPSCWRWWSKLYHPVGFHKLQHSSISNPLGTHCIIIKHPFTLPCPLSCCLTLASTWSSSMYILYLYESQHWPMCQNTHIPTFLSNTLDRRVGRNGKVMVHKIMVTVWGDIFGLLILAHTLPTRVYGQWSNQMGVSCCSCREV